MQLSNHRFLRHVVAPALIPLVLCHSSVGAQQLPRDEPVLLNEVVVRVDVASWPAPAEIVQGIIDANPTLLQRTASPVRARYLQSLRILPVFLGMLPKTDPRVALHEAVVLSYATAADADVAELLLRADPSVFSVQRGLGMRYSVEPTAPNDPLLTPTSNIQEYQWAADRMKLLDAWKHVRGSAYVADLDNGVQIRGIAPNLGTHPDLLPNYRSQFSRNFDLHNGPLGAANSASNLDEEPYTNTTGTNVAGHGSHTAGILGAAGNNGIGGTGVCYTCSLMLGRVSTWYGDASTGYLTPSIPAIIDGMGWMTAAGAQVINESFGYTSAGCNYPGAVGTLCAALDAAAVQDVAVVAAAGNGQRTAFDFPANYASVIGVAGAQFDSAGGVRFWTGSGGIGSNWNYAGSYFSAPALDVIATVYTGTNWNPASYCGDGFPSSAYQPGYGDCTGTSMASPHMAGIVALVRSVQPTMAVSNVKAVLSANVIACNGSDGYKCGYGMPDAGRSVQAALGGATVANRLTPLFSFYSNVRSDHLYTVVPQMGAAAILGTLLPLTYTGNQYGYGSIGPLTSGYTAFPGVPLTGCGFSPPCDPLYPRAMLSVFTSFRDPRGGLELAPLYRLSWACPNWTDPACSNHEHTSHVYSTDPNGEGWAVAGYAIDGIEGYIYSKAAAHPPGTIKVCRKYSSSRDDYILFPGNGAGGTDCSANTDGYTPGGSVYTQNIDGEDWIGWAYPARAPQPIYGTAYLAAQSLLLDD